MTNEQNALICRRLCGYEVQVSPAGKHYIVTDEGTREMPDFENDWHEAMTTLIAVCKSRKLHWGIGGDSDPEWGACVFVEGRHSISNKHPLSALAHCLLQIAEGEE